MVLALSTLHYTRYCSAHTEIRDLWISTEDDMREISRYLCWEIEDDMREISREISRVKLSWIYRVRWWCYKCLCCRMWWSWGAEPHGRRLRRGGRAADHAAGELAVRPRGSPRQRARPRGARGPRPRLPRPRPALLEHPHLPGPAPALLRAPPDGTGHQAVPAPLITPPPSEPWLQYLLSAAQCR